MREIKAKLNELLQTDEPKSVIHRELEAEYAVLSEAAAKVYKTEKDKLQDTIECLEAELRVRIIITAPIY